MGPGPPATTPLLLPRQGGPGTVRAYLQKVTGRSRAQVTRLIRQYRDSGGIRDRRAKPARPFPRRSRRYTETDVTALAKMDNLRKTRCYRGCRRRFEQTRPNRVRVDNKGKRKKRYPCELVMPPTRNSDPSRTQRTTSSRVLPSSGWMQSQGRSAIMRRLFGSTRPRSKLFNTTRNHAT